MLASGMKDVARLMDSGGSMKMAPDLISTEASVLCELAIWIEWKRRIRVRREVIVGVTPGGGGLVESEFVVSGGRVFSCCGGAYFILFLGMIIGVVGVTEKGGRRELIAASFSHLM